MATGKRGTRRSVLGSRGEKILKAVYFYRYMTAVDVCSLLSSPGALVHVRRALTELSGGGDHVEGEYLYRFALGEARSGNRVRVYTLGSRGRDFFKSELEYPVAWYFRPDKVRHLSFGQLLHNLLLTRVLVAARKWSGEREGCKIVDMRTCYETGSDVPSVELVAGGKTARIKVIPDAWVLFEVLREGEWFASPVLFEVDRGTAYKHKFKEIAARLEYIKAGGVYSRLFGRREVTMAYVTTGETAGFRESRRRSMCAWTQEVLRERNKESWAPVFRFGSVAFEEIYEGRLFEEKVWYVPGDMAPVGLFEG